MAGVAFEEFSAPPGSDLALPPLFGGHILESELDTEVEFVDGGGGLGGPPNPQGGAGGESAHEQEDEEEALRRQRELHRRKVQALARRCREIEQVNARALRRLQQVQRLTRQLQRERRFLMKVLDSYGDEYRHGQLTILLQDEGADAPTPGNAENEPPEKEVNRGAPPLLPSVPPPEPPNTKRRRRTGRDERGGRRGGAGGPLRPEGFGTQKGETDESGPPPAWPPPQPP
ncbi:TCF3 fusion partner [Cuculus canorus]|uniref:TCF3 fusion partner n=1 Tax=Cuculus canorus TaxID=55661 RepID=UPI0023AB0F93|nr:TCF3 fusion partner [Cuculus canorus]